mgnify:FL=1|jgi:hypothetical protein
MLTVESARLNPFGVRGEHILPLPTEESILSSAMSATDYRHSGRGGGSYPQSYGYQESRSNRGGFSSGYGGGNRDFRPEQRSFHRGGPSRGRGGRGGHRMKASDYQGPPPPPGNPYNLPPHVLALFAARPAVPPTSEGPVAKKGNYTGLAAFMNHFEEKDSKQWQEVRILCGS